MLAPFAIAWRLVVESSQELELLKWNLRRWDTEFVIEFADCCVLHACDSLLKFDTTLTGDSKGVGAACVCPHIRERDLLGGTLLQKQLVIWTEEENRESAVE